MLSTDSIMLHFGQMVKELIIQIDNKIPEIDIVIPKILTQQITIPDVPYECYFNENHLIIGPVIGFIPLKVFYSNPKKMLLRFSNYNKIKGLIFIFRPKNIDHQNKTITGYYFEPKSREFIKATFPYPKAVYCRSKVSKKVYNKLGGNLFNFPYTNFSKKLFRNLMKKDPLLKNYIPETRDYSGLKSVLNMLKNHGSIYLKPPRLSQGRGIFRLKQDNDDYVLNNQSFRELKITTEEELSKILENKIHGDYLVQQEILSIQQDTKIDFRAYFHKGTDKQWMFTAFETKVGKEGSVISNFKNRETMMSGYEALQKFYDLNSNESDEKIKELSRICIEAIRLVENKIGPLGETAVDFIIDKDLKIWLLEVQVNFAADKKLTRSKAEKAILPLILPVSFLYAKALAGFEDK